MNEHNLLDKVSGDVPTDYISFDEYDESGNLIKATVKHRNVPQHTFHKESTLTDCRMIGVTSIGSGAFACCTSLALTSLPDGITSILGDAFYGCTNLALTSLPDGITFIGSYAFYQCSSLALTELPSELRSIFGNAFGDCTNLTSITFKGKPDSISKTAFSGCTNLTDIKVPWSKDEVPNAPWGAENAVITYDCDSTV